MSMKCIYYEAKYIFEFEILLITLSNRLNLNKQK